MGLFDLDLDQLLDQLYPRKRPGPQFRPVVMRAFLAALLARLGASSAAPPVATVGWSGSTPLGFSPGPTPRPRSRPFGCTADFAADCGMGLCYRSPCLLALPDRRCCWLLLPSDCTESHC